MLLLLAVCVVITSALPFQPTQFASSRAMACRCTVQFSNTSTSCTGNMMTFTDDITYGTCTSVSTKPVKSSWRISLDCSHYLWWDNLNCAGSPTKRIANDGTECIEFDGIDSMKANCQVSTSHRNGIPKSKLCKCMVAAFSDVEACQQTSETTTEYFPKGVCLEGDQHAANGTVKSWYKMAEDCSSITTYSDAACTKMTTTLKDGTCTKGVRLMCSMSSAVNTVVPAMLLLLVGLLW
eukprot:TRINITY_DN74777_c0_g1_i1.p1 TRINITY_DN74777_c0_g1~~TRINITY_DN74777_c0_g1_i1.p1  ORF type:complete len:237 (-),score=27.62 TRINITY_DN74777_c0_g1_i1:161-871(-)